MKKTRLGPVSMADFLEKLPDEVGDILDTIIDPQAKKCIPLVLQTLKDLTNAHFDYLPVGEREDILTHCGTWLDMGMLIGSAPQKFKELLVQTKAKVVVLDEPEDPTPPSEPQGSL